jgi:hypothetical protein
MEAILAKHCDLNGILYTRAKLANKHPLDITGKHVHLKALNEICIEQNLRKIGFVRNPWDKVVSWFNYLKVNTKSAYAISLDLQFEDFIASAPKFIFTQSSEFLTLEDGTLGVDFLGKFESLEEDFIKMCDFLQIDRLPLNNLNSSNNKRHYSEFHTTATKELIADRFAADIKLFDYMF